MSPRILVPLDSSSASLRGLDEAIHLAVHGGCALRLVHVVETARYAGGSKPAGADLIPWMERVGAQILQLGRARAEAAGVPAQTLLFTARTECAADIVIEQARAWGAGLVVIGSSGQGHGLGQAVQAAGAIPVHLATCAAQAGKTGDASADDDVAAAA